ncbi:hypothetical protein EWM64_g1838 [Hericium alpestre]|uniref:CsbD-like domain-containing protein n=1 Tax=Hericium alpestre TaxID=135208 RepID=A0A4Z0A756_9AGAM|nr:hypothetical protein EWM64_g1838 [Hericium alpestre]
MSQFDPSSNDHNAFGSRGERQTQSGALGAQGIQHAAHYGADTGGRTEGQTTGYTSGRTEGQTTGFDQGGRFENRDPAHARHQAQPGVQGFQPAAHYGADTTGRTEGQTTGFDQGGRFENRPERVQDSRVQGSEPTYDIHEQPEHSRMTEHQGTRAGHAAPGHQGDLQGKASVMDKVIGGAQKMTGKLTNNPEKQEQGEVRETSGKAAAQDLGNLGSGRVSRD